MKQSRLRVGLSILGILIASCVAGFELIDSLGPDLSSDGQIRKLDSYWSSRRKAAATDLAQFTGEPDKVIPALVKALDDSDTDVRLSALASLKIFGDKAKPAAKVAGKMMQQDPDAKIRQRAAALIGAIKDPNEVPILVTALDDPDPAVRLEAVRSFGWFGPDIAKEPIVDKLLLGLRPEHPEEFRDATIETLASLARYQERVARAIADASAKDPSSQIRNKAVGIMKTPTFAFQVPALVVALDDPSPQVRLTAGTNLAWIGLSDDRVVPALCHAALNADDATREGIGSNIEILILERPNDKTPDEQLTRRFQAAVREFQTVLETREAAAREQVIGVLCRLLATYQKTGKSALFEPARAAVKVVLARVEDEKEEVSIRLHAISQFSMVRQVGDSRSPQPGQSQSAAPAPKDQLHYRASWVTALGGAIKSPTEPVRSRALEILMDNFIDPVADPSFRDAWREIVPVLAEVTKSEDPRVSNAALVLLGMLGPEATQALPTLRSLSQNAPEAAVRSAAEGAIQSISCLDDLKAKEPTVRVAAAEALGRLHWPATRGVPVLITILKDPDTKVRIAVANALRSLAPESMAAVNPLATALANEADPGVRVAILEALEAIAPGTPPALDAHLNALHDPEPSVRTAAAGFQKVPTDDSMIAALGSALGDPSEEVRLKAAGSLTEILFANPAVIPMLLKALSDDKQRKAVTDALTQHLEETTDQADFGRVRGNLPGLKATLSTAIPAIVQALSLNNEESRSLVFGILGRIVAFSSLSRDADLRAAIEPALLAYLKGLDESVPAIRQEVLDRLEAVPIRREEIVLALQKFVEKPDLPPGDRQTALLVLKEKSAPPAEKGARKASSRKKGVRGGLTGLSD